MSLSFSEIVHIIVLRILCRFVKILTLRMFELLDYNYEEMFVFQSLIFLLEIKSLLFRFYVLWPLFFNKKIKLILHGEAKIAVSYFINKNNSVHFCATFQEKERRQIEIEAENKLHERDRKLDMLREIVNDNDCPTPVLRSKGSSQPTAKPRTHTTPAALPSARLCFCSVFFFSLHKCFCSWSMCFVDHRSHHINVFVNVHHVGCAL